jgi:hypothetical protein
LSVLYLTQDLLFSSRVGSIAKQMGVDVLIVSTLDQLQEKLSSAPSAILVDLEHRSDPLAVMSLVKAISPRPTAIAYGPHVKESLLANAQAAGFDHVLSRGQFDKQIAQILQSMTRKS